MPSVFTKIINGEIPCYKIYEDDKTLAFLDINPESKGHTLVVPKNEVDKIYELPDEDYYDGYPQLDNGVGLIKSMENEVLMRIEELKEEGFKLDEPRCVSSVTGEAAYPFISRMAKLLMETFEGLTFNVY